MCLKPRGVEIEASDVLWSGTRAAERLIRALTSYDDWPAWTVSVHDERGWLVRHCPSLVVKFAYRRANCRPPCSIGARRDA